MNFTRLTQVSAVFLLSLIFTCSAFATTKFSIRPVDPEIARFSFDLDPGESIETEFELVNLGDEPILLSVTPVDAKIDEFGNFTLVSVNNDQNYIGNWVEVTDEYVEVQPGERLDYPFTLTVPEDTLPGQYAGGLVATSVLPEALLSDDFTGFALTGQVGTRIYLNVNGEIIDSLVWDQFEFGREYDKNQYLDFSFTNEGNSILDVTTLLTVNGVEQEHSLGVLFPGDSTEPELALPMPFFGDLNVEANVTYQRSSAFSTEEAEIVTLDSRAVTKSFFPWTLLLSVLGGLAALLAVIFFFKWRSNKFKSTLVKYKVKKSEDIQTIAEAHKFSWKKLAKLNQIKAPYHLNTGDVILVPKKKK